jgi:hypothetical protein
MGDVSKKYGVYIEEYSIHIFIDDPKVFYLIVDKINVGQHATYITNLARGCRLMKLSMPPQEKDNIQWDKEYARYIDKIIGEVNWEYQILFIIVFGVGVTASERLKTRVSGAETKDFQWQKPIMKR